jgi:hypothetical protein
MQIYHRIPYQNQHKQPFQVQVRFKILMLALPGPVSEWSIEKVGDWVEELSKKIDIGDGNALKQIFIGNRMNGRNLMEFTTNVGVLMNIPVGDALRIEQAISNLKQGIFHIQNS